MHHACVLFLEHVVCQAREVLLMDVWMMIDDSEQVSAHVGVSLSSSLQLISGLLPS